MARQWLDHIVGCGKIMVKLASKNNTEMFRTGTGIHKSLLHVLSAFPGHLPVQCHRWPTTDNVPQQWPLIFTLRPPRPPLSIADCNVVWYSMWIIGLGLTTIMYRWNWKIANAISISFKWLKYVFSQNKLFYKLSIHHNLLHLFQCHLKHPWKSIYGTSSTRI